MKDTNRGKRNDVFKIYLHSEDITSLGNGKHNVASDPSLHYCFFGHFFNKKILT